MGFVSLGRSASSPFKDLEKLPHSMGSANTLRRVDTLLAAFEMEVEKRISQEASTAQEQAHLAIFIDDYHLLSARADKTILQRLEALIQKGQEAGITLFIVVPNLGLRGAGDSLIRRLKTGKTGLWLKSVDITEARTVGLSIPPRMRGQQWPPGRGYLYDPGGQVLLQVASGEIENLESSQGEAFPMTSDYVEEILRLSKE